MSMGKTVQTVEGKEQEISLQIEIDITPAYLERLNKLGLKDNVKRLLWSNIIADSIDNLYHDDSYLGYYVKRGAEIEGETGKESSKNVIIPVVIPAELIEKIKVEAGDDSEIRDKVQKDVIDLYKQL